MPINFMGLDSFSEEEADVLKELVFHHYRKMKQRDIKKFNLIVNAKKVSKSNKPYKAVRYTLQTRIDAPHTLVSSECSDFDLRRVCHEVMVKLENEFNHKFKSDTSYSKPYYKR